jgi:hypothetical protein
MAAGQIEALDQLLKKQSADQQARTLQMRAFWADTLPVALDLPFAGLEVPAARNLRELEAILTRHAND